MLEEVASNTREVRARGILCPATDVITARDVYVETPAPLCRTLFRALNFELATARPSNLIVVGPSGCGQ